MTGCPNGCARPYLAEIGLVGRAPGVYNLYLGGAFDGTRLNKLYRKEVGDDAIVAALAPLLRDYAAGGTTANGSAITRFAPDMCARPQQATLSTTIWPPNFADELLRFWRCAAGLTGSANRRGHWRVQRQAGRRVFEHGLDRVQRVAQCAEALQLAARWGTTTLPRRSNSAGE